MTCREIGREVDVIYEQYGKKRETFVGCHPYKSHTLQRGAVEYRTDQKLVDLFCSLPMLLA
jgi:hypothetical protein